MISMGVDIITFLSKNDIALHCDSLSLFEKGLISSFRCLVCDAEIFDKLEADEHVRSIHPVALADDKYKTGAIRSCKTWSVTTFTCSVCHNITKHHSKKCVKCGRTFREVIKG